MSVNDLLDQVHCLKPSEKYILIENLIQDLNHIDENIEKLWIEESSKRLNLYNKGELETVSISEVFADVHHLNIK